LESNHFSVAVFYLMDCIQRVIMQLLKSVSHKPVSHNINSTVLENDRGSVLWIFLQVFLPNEYKHYLINLNDGITSLKFRNGAVYIHGYLK
jgi:hypothetical protein